jgi:nucleoside-diphosphate-sugar epimerase
MQKILVTGNLGYIGYIMTEELLKEDYDVVGFDTNFYADKLLFDFEYSKDFTQINKDIRNISSKALKGVDAVIHLAALSNDPLGELNPGLTEEINLDHSLRLATLAKKAGVERILFSSSCSIYGETNNESLTEEDEMNPVSAYAESKIKLEKELSELADKNFSPVYFRNGTAYGVSPSMRFDLVLNNLMGWAYTTDEIKILSDGRAWRPIVHIRDISKAFIAGLKAPKEVIHDQAFNVGLNSENYQVKEMAEKIHELMPECEVKIMGKHNPDQRTYVVNFDKINDTLKHFTPKWNIEKGVSELLNTFKKVELTEEKFQDRHFTRIKQLKYLRSNNLLDENLFWKKK